MTKLLLCWHHTGGMLLQRQGSLIFTSPDCYFPTTYLHAVKVRESQNEAISLWTPLQARHTPQFCLVFDDFCPGHWQVSGWCCLWAEWELKNLKTNKPQCKWCVSGSVNIGITVEILDRQSRKTILLPYPTCTTNIWYEWIQPDMPKSAGVQNRWSACSLRFTSSFVFHPKEEGLPPGPAKKWPCGNMNSQGKTKQEWNQNWYIKVPKSLIVTPTSTINNGRENQEQIKHHEFHSMKDRWMAW